MKKTLLLLVTLSITWCAHAAQIIVTSNADSGPNTLRQAVLDAADNDEIIFNLPSGSETIEIIAPSLTTGHIEINKSITIDGANAAGSGVPITLFGNGNDVTLTLWTQIFHIPSTATGKTINIKNMTISEGHSTEFTAGGRHGGGAIGCEGGTVNIDSVLFTNNKATGDNVSGGAIYIENEDTHVTISNSTFYENLSGGSNSFVNAGGAIGLHEASLIVKNCTFNLNFANVGGAISVLDYSASGTTVEISNSTFYQNVAVDNDNTSSSDQDGGAIYFQDMIVAASLTLKSNTIIANSAVGDGDGIYLQSQFGGTLPVTMENNIIANNGTHDFYSDGATITNSYNIIERSSGFTSGTGDITGEQANLFGTGLTTQTLADNGGPTQTLALETGSVAIASGINDASYLKDQRGKIRQTPSSIGAFEISIEPSVPTLTYLPAKACKGEETTITINGTLNDAEKWSVYTNSCGGTLLGTTSTGTFMVTQTSPVSTYYIRGEGEFTAMGNCGSVEITVTDLDVSVTNVNGMLSSNQDGVSYQWINCADQSDISGETNQTFTPQSSGSYSVKITDGTCNAESNCNTVDVVNSINTSTLNSEVSIHPNPAQNLVNISTDQNIRKIDIYTLSGTILNTVTVDAKNHRLDVSELESGVYILIIETTNGMTQNRIVKL